jgi:uncharacterized damage-inducible protein DinB
MDQNVALRAHLHKMLDWEDAHIGFDAAIKEIPANLRGVQPQGLPYSAWQVLEHMRICQLDILDFCRNPEYREKPLEEFWPKTIAPPTEDAWNDSIEAFRKDRESLKQLAMEPGIDLFGLIPHGTGQTYLRELLLVSDHNAYHTADVVAIRRVLGIWR